jgi:hypothetical protein
MRRRARCIARSCRLSPGAATQWCSSQESRAMRPVLSSTPSPQSSPAPSPRSHRIPMLVRSPCGPTALSFSLSVSKRLMRVSVIRLVGRVSESIDRVQVCQAWFSLPSRHVSPLSRDDSRYRASNKKGASTARALYLVPIRCSAFSVAGQLPLAVHNLHHHPRSLIKTGMVVCAHVEDAV